MPEQLESGVKKKKYSCLRASCDSKFLADSYFSLNIKHLLFGILALTYGTQEMVNHIQRS
jgi:hypothetical protein